MIGAVAGEQTRMAGRRSRHRDGHQCPAKFGREAIAGGKQFETAERNLTVETGLDCHPNVTAANGLANLRSDRGAIMDTRIERAHFFERRDDLERCAIRVCGVDHLALYFGRLLCAHLLHPGGRSGEAELRRIGVQLRGRDGFDVSRLRRLARFHIDLKRIYQTFRAGEQRRHVRLDLLDAFVALALGENSIAVEFELAHSSNLRDAQQLSDLGAHLAGLGIERIFS